VQKDWTRWEANF